MYVRYYVKFKAKIILYIETCHLIIKIFQRAAYLVIAFN